jgi:predicted ester cyclase
MGAEGNVVAVQRAVGRWNAGELEGYLQLYDPGIVMHGLMGVEPGLDSARQFYQGIWAGVPGGRLIFDDVFAEGDKVVIRFRLEGTHRGILMGVPATGKEISLLGITILRFQGGRCVERWTQTDALGMLQQLGVMPGPG